MARGPRKTGSAHRKPPAYGSRRHGLGGHQPLCRSGLPQDQGDPGGASRAGKPADGVSDEIGVCAVCSRQARGFGFCLRLKRSQFAFYKFCSRRCQDIGAILAQRSYGMIDKTAREAQAIRDARKSFAEALTTLGLMAPLPRSTSSSRRRSPATSTACRPRARGWNAMAACLKTPFLFRGVE